MGRRRRLKPVVQHRMGERSREIGRRLNAAFRDMRKDFALVARRNFQCCSGCAAGPLAEMMDQRGATGAVFYHAQDAEVFDRPCGGILHVRFVCSAGVALRDRGRMVRDVGRIAQVMLERHGLRTKWNGDPENTIQVEIGGVEGATRDGKLVDLWGSLLQDPGPLVTIVKE